MNPKEFLDFLIRRRSIRKYLEKPISDEDLNMILEAGRWAPSGTNRQPWKFIIIKNRELLQQIVKRRKDLGLPAGLPLRTAQLGIAVVGNIGEYPKIEANLERINGLFIGRDEYDANGVGFKYRYLLHWFFRSRTH